MDLRLTTLELSTFRNYQAFNLEDIGLTTIFTGPNAIGKTNLIEAIQLLISGSSLRKAKIEEMVAWDEEQARIAGSLLSNTRKMEIEVLLSPEGKKHFINGKAATAQNLRELVPTVTFLPDDLAYVKAGPSRRRTLLDTLGNQLSKNYAATRRDYEKLIRQKNQLLKDECSAGYLDSVNEVLARIAAVFYRYRCEVVESVKEELSRAYREITDADENISLSYEPSWLFLPERRNNQTPEDILPNKEATARWFEKLLFEMEEEERRVHSCVVGPHKDRPVFLIDGRDAASFASQGQQRSISLAYRIAELHILEKRREQKPILLLDDVMSELDERRRSALMGYVSHDIQTFITTTNLDYFSSSMLSSARVVTIGT